MGLLVLKDLQTRQQFPGDETYSLYEPFTF